MVLSFDGDAIAFEEVERIFGKVLVEHRQDLWGDVVDCYFDAVN